MKKVEHETKNKARKILAVGIGIAALLVIGMGMIFNGCAHHSADAGIFSAKGMSYSHSVPETVKLSDYKVIQVQVTSPIKKSDAFCCQLRDKITGMLVEKKLFEKVLKGGESMETSADLSLDSEIVVLDKVTALERMLFDDFVGKAKMVVINRLKDVKTGKELGTFTTGGQSASGGIASMFAAGTTKQALKHTAQQIVEFIQTHM